MQANPSEHCYVLMQDHGSDGGWGTASVQMGLTNGPFVYTGSDEQTILALHSIATTLANATGKPTLLAKFTQREDVLMIEGRKEQPE